jgi:predicted DNA-binding transcriptional regulator AlpA
MTNPSSLIPEWDEWVPDPQVCKELGVSAMWLWRQDHAPPKPEEGVPFPARIKLGRRNVRSRKWLELYKKHRHDRAIAEQDLARRKQLDAREHAVAERERELRGQEQGRAARRPHGRPRKVTAAATA